MTKRDIVLDAVNHRPTPFVPYTFDLTQDMRSKVLRETGEDNLPQKHGVFLAGDCDGKMVQLDSHRKQDQFGVVWLMDQRGDFGVVDHITLPEPTLDGYVFPKPDEADIRQKCQLLTTGQNRELFTTFGISFSLFERAWSLRGMENLLMDFLLEPEFGPNLRI